MESRNGTTAGVRFGLDTVDAIGHENLRKPEVAAFLAQRQQELQERTEITQEMVLKRYWEIATADLKERVARSEMLRSPLSAGL